MDLDLTSEQELLRESVRRICARHAGLDVVRKMENDPIGYPPQLWAQLADSGLIGLTLPDRWGGSAMTLLEAALVYGEFGRSLAPSPHFVSSVLCGGVLARGGTDEQRERFLPGIADGSAVWSVAWLEPAGGFGPRGIGLRAEAEGDGWRLDGVKRHVAYATAADRLLVLAETADGITLFVVDPSSPGVSLTQQLSVASDTQYRVEFAAATVPADAVVGAPGAGWAIWEEVAPAAMILLAAQAVGGARRSLELAVDYAATRRQFDKPLGAFQAIAHYLADATTAVDGAETLVWEAAWAASAGRSTARLAPMAKLFACQTFRDVTAMAQQIFGGVGFALEFDVQLFFRRAKALQVAWWDGRYLEELIAAEVLDA
ncbi:MAG TPA: acyl-CoA dehydrogenase family protein [Mycobacteriales bacterium]|nr:acyl-CoA dehydrogenase family protein [Mycobacteriales bacterium]